MSAKKFKALPKKRFGVGAEVRVKLPGLNGIVTQMDSSPTVLGEYWHTVRAEFGDRKEPGSNLELIPAPTMNTKPKEFSAPMTNNELLASDQAISLLRTQLEEPMEDLRHDDPEVEGWERITLSIVERTFGERSRNANHFAVTLSYARQSEEEKKAWHVKHIREKKVLIRAFIKELEIIPPHRPHLPDERFARMAVDEARKSNAEDARVHPMVGCVVVKDGRVLVTAHRGEMEGNHAEFIALEKKLKDVPLAGSTVYTTLEPCTTRNHPKIPCADRLIERRVARVVIGTLDPNPEIRGKGMWKLQQASIAVDMFPHALAMELNELNRHFFRSFDERQTAASLAQEGALSHSAVSYLGSELMRSSFRENSEPLGVFWSPIPAYIKKAPVSEIRLSAGPAMWLRLIPATKSTVDLSLPKLRGYVMSDGKLWLEPLNWGDIGFIRAEDGFGVYSRTHETDAETNSVAFVFEDGQVWAVDTGLLTADPNTISFADIYNAMCSRLPRYGRFAQSLGNQPPFRWIAGLEGVKGRRLEVQPQGEGISHLGESCLRDQVFSEGSYDGVQEPRLALAPFFRELFRRCSMQFPEFLQM